MAGSCYRCTYLQKKPARGGYFYFTCTFWGIRTKGIAPHSVVISSIGKACPYFDSPQNKDTHTPENNDPGNTGGGLDIIV